MSKFLRFFGVMSLIASLSACNENDGPNPDPAVTVTSGAIIINQGSYYANIAGSLSYIDFATQSANQNVFQTANESAVIGDTPQSAIVYGSKLYVAVYSSNLIRVLDPTTFKLIKDIRPDASTGTQPRYFAADKGKVYVTMYDGYVARIDTTSLAIDASVKVGSNPDGIAVCGNYIYAANCDGMNYENDFANGNTVSKIAISSFTEIEKINVGMNPGAVAAVGNNIFVVVRGNYGSVPSKLKCIKQDGTVSEIAEATYISPAATSIVYVNAPWGVTVDKVYAYNPTTASTNSISVNPVNYPAAIGVDPYTGAFIITGYTLNSSGAPDYMAPGFADLYDGNGEFVKKFDTGLNPCAVTFNTFLQ